GHLALRMAAWRECVQRGVRLRPIDLHELSRSASGGCRTGHGAVRGTEADSESRLRGKRRHTAGRASVGQHLRHFRTGREFLRVATGRDLFRQRFGIVASDDAATHRWHLCAEEVQQAHKRIDGSGATDSVCEDGISDHTRRVRAARDGVRYAEAGCAARRSQWWCTDSTVRSIEWDVFAGFGKYYEPDASAGIVLVSTDTGHGVLSGIRSVAERAAGVAVQRIQPTE